MRPRRAPALHGGEEVSYWSGWPYTGYGLGFLVTGVISYAFVRRKSGLRGISKGVAKGYWYLVYLGGVLMLSYLGPSAFNGLNCIRFPYDEVFVFAFSLAVYFLAYIQNSRV